MALWAAAWVVLWVVSVENVVFVVASFGCKNAVVVMRRTNDGQQSHDDGIFIYIL